MDGKHGPMYIGEFEDIVKRNAYAPWDFRLYSSRWGRHLGAPATLVKGNMDNGDARNIPVPDIPENTVLAADGRHVKHRGWRQLFIIMCRDRWLSPSREIEKWLGTKDFEEARRGLGCV